MVEPPRYSEELTMKAVELFDQGEQVFEVVFLVLWLAFVVFLACCAVRLVRENARKKATSRRKRRDHRASPARGLR
jgi:hypothetical protein